MSLKLTPSSASPVPFGSEETPEKEMTFDRWLYQRVFRHLLSTHGQTILIGMILFVMLILLLSLDFFRVSQITENNIGRKNIFAPYDLPIEDKSATQVKMEQARNSVHPVFQSEPEINARVKENLMRRSIDLRPVFLDRSLTEENRHKTLISLLGKSSATELVYFDILKDKNTMPSPTWWDRIRLTSQVTLDRVLKDGLSAEEFLENPEAVIDKNIPKKDLRQEEILLVRLMVGSILQPNHVVDEEATVKARESSAKSVQPVIRTFRRGEKIIGIGEPVSQVQLDALEAIGKSTKGIQWTTFLGISILTLAFVTVIWTYLYHFEDHQYFRPTYAGMIATMTVGAVTLFKLFREIPDFSPYLFPLATFSLTITVFTHPRVGILSTALLVFLMGLTLKVDFSVLSVLLLGSVVGVFVLSRKLHSCDRSPLMHAGLSISITSMLMVSGTFLMNPPPSTTPWNDLAILLLLSGLGGLISVIFTLGTLPFIESVFRVMTPYTLMELANHDKPLLKRLQFEAPGTFHHSLMVASMAEAAAEAIGANTLLARVGALYHDIGKMKRPIFFIENQAYFGVENPHDKLTPRLSKMVVTAHPRDSLEMARHYKIPDVITKFMTEHHGTMVAGYFYNQACMQEGVENVNKSQFRYAGPKPNIKETAIVMLADACESACRALKNPSVKQIEERIDKIIQQRIEDNQFDNCPITFKDISIIRQTFVRVLRGIQHNRIEYQQNVMKELGRKIPQKPAPKLPTPELVSEESSELDRQLLQATQSANGTHGSSTAPPSTQTKESLPSSPGTPGPHQHGDIDDPCCNPEPWDQ